MNDTEILTRAARILEDRAKYNTVRDTFTCPEAVRRYLAMKFASLPADREHFLVLYLDNRHALLEANVEFTGTIDQAAVYPREILKRALVHGANAVILAHNHPSGNPTPSSSDEGMTAKLKAALATVDIRTLDHLIVVPTEIVSMVERGML